LPTWSLEVRRKPSLYVRIRTRWRRLAERARRRGAAQRPDGYVFIVTYGRTGSTLLQKLLNTMDGVYVAGENHNVLRGLYEAWRNAGVTRLQFGGGHQAVGDPWHGAMMVDPDAFARQLAEAFVANVLRPPRGSRIVGFKEIRYLTPDLAEQLDFMAQAFAPAKFVFNRRNVDAVSQSGWWRDADHQKLGADVARFDAITTAWAAANPGTSVRLDYDEWTADASSLRSVYALLDTPFDAKAAAAVLAVRLQHMQPKG
jgi:hypothetical protein